MHFRKEKMNKTLLSILIALVFVFGSAGVTVAAAQQSQPGEALYTLRTWSTQILRHQDKTQIQADEIETGLGAYDRTDLQKQEMLQMQSALHEQETIHQTSESPALHNPDDHSGTSIQGRYSDHVIEANHEGDQTHQEHNGNDHGHD